MRVQVSEYAARQLDGIWDYYATEAGVAVADRITKKVVDDIQWLEDHPRGGQYEPLLDHLGLNTAGWFQANTRSCIGSSMT